MSLPPIDTTYLVEFLTKLLNTPSPTGFAQAGIACVDEALRAFPGLQLTHTRKGALLATWPGEESSSPRALTAHVDTLGAMVKEIKPNGRLKLSKIGGYAWNTVEGEGCTIFTAKGQKIRGSILLTKASSHVYSSQVNELKREDENMEVRLDARTANPEETRRLGIEVGDFVAFDPRVEVTEGFVRSRHLDDKACAACMVAAVKALQDAGLKPRQKTYLFFSNYEEVGHGASSGIPEDAAELLVVDMAAVGEGQTSDEFHTTLCVKDSGGPYHHELSQRLRRLADENDIPYRVDIYPYYGSDGEALWRAGGDLAVALVGPGVDASHNYERTHVEALEATTRWLEAYLLST
ncbi:MAG: M42 family metallopeptidase [Chloroflexi bacterium]|nr:M42 family metallopeptidase [Chloroflexota bacterium]